MGERRTADKMGGENGGQDGSGELGTGWESENGAQDGSGELGTGW